MCMYHTVILQCYPMTCSLIYIGLMCSNPSYRYIYIYIYFFLNNQPDALINKIYCHKTLRVSGIFSAHHQEFSTVHSAPVSFMQVLMTASKQSQDGTPCSSILTLLGRGHQNLHETYQCRMKSRKLLMMGRGDARNM